MTGGNPSIDIIWMSLHVFSIFKQDDSSGFAVLKKSNISISRNITAFVK